MVKPAFVQTMAGKKNSLRPKPGRERLSQKPILILSRIVCRFLTQKDYDLLVANYNHCGLYIKK